MTPAEFKSARQAIGLTQSALARRLGLSPVNGDRSIRRWEGEPGKRGIPGPVAELLRGWLRARKPKV